MDMPTRPRTSRDLLLFALVQTLAGCAVSSQSPTPSPGQSSVHMPAAGFVPDSVTAVRIAVAVWTPIFGEAQVAAQSPYRARLEGDVWSVAGTVSAGQRGGGAYAEISKRDARVLTVIGGR
jgi:hypothetical protein